MTHAQGEGAGGSAFSKASFVADDNEVEMDDPDFWTKMLPQAPPPAEPTSPAHAKRRAAQALRFGMVEPGSSAHAAVFGSRGGEAGDGSDASSDDVEFELRADDSDFRASAYLNKELSLIHI